MIAQVWTWTKYGLNDIHDIDYRHFLTMRMTNSNEWKERNSRGRDPWGGSMKASALWGGGVWGWRSCVRLGDFQPWFKKHLKSIFFCMSLFNEDTSKKTPFLYLPQKPFAPLQKTRVSRLVDSFCWFHLRAHLQLSKTLPTEENTDIKTLITRFGGGN